MEPLRHNFIYSHSCPATQILSCWIIQCLTYPGQTPSLGTSISLDEKQQHAIYVCMPVCLTGCVLSIWQPTGPISPTGQFRPSSAECDLACTIHVRSRHMEDPILGRLRHASELLHALLKLTQPATDEKCYVRS